MRESEDVTRHYRSPVARSHAMRRSADRRAAARYEYGRSRGPFAAANAEMARALADAAELRRAWTHASAAQRDRIRDRHARAIYRAINARWRRNGMVSLQAKYNGATEH